MSIRTAVFRSLFLLAHLVVIAGVATTPASAQFTFHETGFTLTTLGTGVGAKGVTCSPGGIWGDYVYFADSGGDLVERVDFFDVGSVFVSGVPDINFPVGLAFGPGPAATFGDFLYVAAFSSGQITRVDPSGTPTFFTAFPQVSDLDFDASGAYGNDLFATQYHGPILTVSPTGVVTPFSTTNTIYLKFGPGGAWGTGLYASTITPGPGISQISPTGTATLLSSGFTEPEQFDWATGGSFGGDMFAVDLLTSEIWRVKPDGTRTLFASGEAFAGLAFCNDCLYIAAFHGGCWKVCNESPVPVEETSWGRIKESYSSPK